MHVKSFLLGAAFVGGFVGFAYAGPISQVSSPAGLFGTPYSENQTWSACNSSGWVPYGDPDSHQYHMQLNEDLSTPKYHMGEDWNGICGGNSDEGAPLLAIADGKVVYVENVVNSQKGKQLHIRYSFPYAPAPNDVQTFDSIYLHINGVNPQKVTFSGPGTGSIILKGDIVAYLGGTGGWTPHLHWEAQWDNDSSLLTENSYKNPLSVSHASKYRAPSLIVDDRRDVLGYRVPAPGGWYSFTMSGNAPSSTMYILYNGQRKSLRNAIVAGWIPAEGILHENNGS